MPQLDKWLCINCRWLLGWVEDKKTVRIKRRDLYVEVNGGQIKVTCCRCGKVNELVDHPEIVNLRES